MNASFPNVVFDDTLQNPSLIQQNGWYVFAFNPDNNEGVFMDARNAYVGREDSQGNVILGSNDGLVGFKTSKAIANGIMAQVAGLLNLLPANSNILYDATSSAVSANPATGEIFIDNYTIVPGSYTIVSPIAGVYLLVTSINVWFVLNPTDTTLIESITSVFTGLRTTVQSCQSITLAALTSLYVAPNQYIRVQNPNAADKYFGYKINGATVELLTKIAAHTIVEVPGPGVQACYLDLTPYDSYAKAPFTGTDLDIIIM